MFDFLVVGAGFAGSVVAERMASHGHRVLVVDRRKHIAGNAYDCLDEAGILIHLYGPHIFHTNSTEVVRYLSQFTEWRPYEHRVLTEVDGKLLPMPINIDTVNGYFNTSLDAEGVAALMASLAEKRDRIETSEDLVVSQVGQELYEKFFRNYTRKQWGRDPKDLDSSVAARVPFRLSHDDRYFTDTFQAMPRDGYTAMFERMLANPLIEVRLGVDYTEIEKTVPFRTLVFTGPIDEYFGYRYGKLPYRSLEFKHETHDTAQFQTAAVVNYPNTNDYTRVTEFKYLTGQTHANTSVVYEYPRAEGDPYYPVPCQSSSDLFARYKTLAEREKHVYFLGRLANYKYFNMDQVVAQALKASRRILEDTATATTVPQRLSLESESSRQVPVQATA